jgi:hemerythrin
MAFPTAIGSLHIGIGIFDREHSALHDILNALQKEIEGRRDDDATGALLTDLARGIEAHFKSEEAMMEASKYPGLMLHAMKHQRLIEQLQALRARYNRDRTIMNKHSLNFLRDWFATHIRNDDMNFSLWQNEHGKL